MFIANLISVIPLLSVNRLQDELIEQLVPSIAYIILLLVQLVNLDGKLKDIYRGIIYITVLIPYNIICTYYDINIVILNAVIYFLDIYLIMRTVLIKIFSNSKAIYVIEKIALVIVYLILLMQSVDSSFLQCLGLDLMLSLLIVLTYLKQENGTFNLTSIAFLIIVFVQTKAVNFPVTWLICLMLFEIGFISFASYNEIKKRKIEK